MPCTDIAVQLIFLIFTGVSYCAIQGATFRYQIQDYCSAFRLFVVQVVVLLCHIPATQLVDSLFYVRCFMASLPTSCVAYCIIHHSTFFFFFCYLLSNLLSCFYAVCCTTHCSALFYLYERPCCLCYCSCNIPFDVYAICCPTHNPTVMLFVAQLIVLLLCYLWHS